MTALYLLTSCFESEVRLQLADAEEAVVEIELALNLSDVPREFRGMLPPADQLATQFDERALEQVFAEQPQLLRGPVEATTDVTAERIAHRERVAVHLAGLLELLARDFEDVGGTEAVVVRDGVAGTIKRGGPVKLGATDRQMLAMLPGAYPKLSFVLDLPDDWPIQAPIIKVNGVLLPVEPTSQSGRRWTVPFDQLFDPDIEWLEVEVTHPLLRDDAPTLQQLLTLFESGSSAATVLEEPPATQSETPLVVAEAPPALGVRNPQEVEAVADLPAEDATTTAPADLSRDGAMPIGRNGFPLLLLHDIAADATVWDALRSHLEDERGWLFGGRLNIMYDGVHCPPDSPCAGFWGRPRVGDFYVADFHDPRANYPNGLGIIQQGREVGAMLARLRELHGPDSRFVVAGHGMGGLAARSYLASLETEYHSDIAQLVTIATPHGGTPLAGLLEEPDLRDLLIRQGLYLASDDQGVRDLSPGKSAFLGALQSRPLAEDIRYTAVAVVDTDCGATTRFFEVLGPSDCLVPFASQDLRNDPAARDQRHQITFFRAEGEHAAARGAGRTTTDAPAIACVLGIDCSTVCSLSPIEAELGAAVCGIALAGQGETLSLDGSLVAIPDPWRGYERLVRLSTSPSGDWHVLLLCAAGFCADVRTVNTNDGHIAASGHAGRYGPHADWTSWAPDEAHVALYGTGEGYSQLHLVRSVDGRSFAHPDYGAQDTLRGGPSLVDRESLRWLGPDELEIRVVPCPSSTGTAICPEEGFDHPGEWRRLSLGTDTLTVEVRR